MSTSEKGPFSFERSFAQTALFSKIATVKMIVHRILALIVLLDASNDFPANLRLLPRRRNCPIRLLRLCSLFEEEHGQDERNYRFISSSSLYFYSIDENRDSL